MGAKTSIEWTDATWNPIGGCSVHSPGCTNCYAQRLCGTRLARHPLYKGTTTPSKAGPVFNGHLTVADDDADVWQFPLRWRGAKQPVRGAGFGSLIFVGDLSDLFHEDRPDEVIDRVFAVMALSRHTFQVLTKRPERARAYFGHTIHDQAFRDAMIEGTAQSIHHKRTGEDPSTWLAVHAPLANVWIGTSVENQRCADDRRPHLRALADMGFTTFVSYEPALGPVQWGGWEFIRWLISGGESGPNARPSHPDWHRGARDWCSAAGIPFFFKQWGGWLPEDQFVGFANTGCAIATKDGEIIRYSHDGGPAWLSRDKTANRDQGQFLLWRVGKTRAGALLDGRAHREWPR